MKDDVSSDWRRALLCGPMDSMKEHCPAVSIRSATSKIGGLIVVLTLIMMLSKESTFLQGHSEVYYCCQR